MVTTLEAVLDEAAGDERHPAMALLDIVDDLIADYESQRDALSAPTGVQALKFSWQQLWIATKS